MAVKALIFGTDDLYPKLKNFYEAEVQRGNFEIVGYAVFENKKWRFQSVSEEREQIVFQIAIISSKNDFYNRMKFLESIGISRNKIIDGSIFQTPNLDFPRLLRENIAYGKFPNPFKIKSYSIYSTINQISNSSIIKCDTRSYIEGGYISGNGVINLGKYTSVSWNTTFNLGENYGHNYHNVSNYDNNHWNWSVPQEFLPKSGTCKIEIKNDVWIGHSCILKSNNPDKPLVIGDGAVIASDSVVVKDVPPYAIVGGNPAQIIKYRFDEKIIESLMKIQWWNWDIEKIYENFKYFNRVEEFVAMHDK